MSMAIEVQETVYYLDVETSYSDTINSLEIEASSKNSIEISSEYFGSVIFASDVVGLDDYIANFIDHYEIDCGPP
jgi:hypothetical protein